MADVTRAQFMSRGTKGGIALVAGGSLLAGAAAPALGQTSKDIRIAQIAATAELLAIDFYTRALRASPAGIEREYLLEARSNERTHYRTLRKVLGPKVPTSVEASFPPGTFDSTQSIARVGVALESAFVRAYLGAVSALSVTKLKVVAARIATNEAQHLSVFSDVLNDEPISLPALPEPISARTALKRLAPFIADVDGAQLTG